MGIQMVQLGYFAISPPTMIAIPSFEQVRVRELLETTCCVESRGNLVGNRFIVNKTVCVRRADRLFIEGFGIYHPVFDSRDFGRSEEHTSELQSHVKLVCRLLLETKKK